MIRINCCAALLLLSVMLLPLSAQEKPEEVKKDMKNAQVAPEVHIVVPSTNSFIEDLEYIIKMTTQPKQIDVLKDYIKDVYLIAVDLDRPLRLDILLDKGPYRKRLYLPIQTKKGLKDFRDDNLEGFNIKSRKVRNTKYLYKLRDAANVTVGWLRWRDKYAILAEVQGDVSLKLPQPLAGVTKLLKLNYDLAIEGKNQPQGIQERHKQFQGTRKELLAALKRNDVKKETVEDFALRKMFFAHQLVELERIYAEAEHLLMGWTTDVKKKQGQLDLTLKPLPGSSLDTSLKLLGKKPSAFANIPKTKTPILSARINFALDEMRKKYFIETIKTLRNRQKAQVDLAKETSAENKTHQKKAWGIYFDMMEAGVKAGLIDTFTEVHPSANGKQTMVGGVQSPDGTALIPLLELFGKIYPDSKPKLNTATVGDVKIHNIQLTKARHPGIVDLFGSETLLVGTSKSVIWYAAGQDALKELTVAINLAAQQNKEKAKAEKKENTNAPLVDIQVKMHPWIKLIDQKRNNQTDKTQSSSKMRKFALIAFAGGQDDLTITLNRVDDHVEGKLVALPGILRFVGEMIADFSKEQLE